MSKQQKDNDLSLQDYKQQLAALAYEYRKSSFDREIRNLKKEEEKKDQFVKVRIDI